MLVSIGLLQIGGGMSSTSDVIFTYVYTIWYNCVTKYIGLFIFIYMFHSVYISDLSIYLVS
jgi:hypothetical protein